MQAVKALEKLKQGNQTFQDNIESGVAMVRYVRREEMANPQKPFAIILGCSDSRVPAELVFDQGLGDLFVIRVAGNVVAPSQIGSVEFACQQFGTELVVVLGHTQCGAITATVDAVMTDPYDISPNLASIVERVKPAVVPLLEKHKESTRSELVSLACHANVAQSVASLQARSAILRSLVKSSKLSIVGAEYAVETGVVTFL